MAVYLKRYRDEEHTIGNGPLLAMLSVKMLVLYIEVDWVLLYHLESWHTKSSSERDDCVMYSTK